MSPPDPLSSWLHPWRIVTGAIHGPVLGRAKRFVVHRLYNYLARRYPTTQWTTMNYGYAPVEGETLPIAAVLSDERYALQLYARVATSGRHGADLSACDIVEIGSGRGGGAAFVATTFHPKSYLALDISAPATALARARYANIDRLRFAVGDAERLPLADACADIALNIESAHGYASLPNFLAEAGRVLRPGGELLFAGFFAQGTALDKWHAAVAASPLLVVREDDISAQVGAALVADDARKRILIDTLVAGPFRYFARGAYALAGSPMHGALLRGDTRYIATVLRKPPINAGNAAHR